MQVSLIDYTGFGSADPARRAAEVLLFTKSTRLTLSPSLMETIQKLSSETVEEELAYIANTIPSSWEFIDYTFLIEDVTRAFTHQFVRTRTASYAQQTMRVLAMGEFGYETGPTINSSHGRIQIYDDTMDAIKRGYHSLVQDGAAIEDARGVLPTNILTNIAVKMNLRTFSGMARKRASSRTQGEYRSVMEAMKAEVLRVHPWVSLFLDRTVEKACSELEAAILKESGYTKEYQTQLVKLIDQIRMAQDE